MSKITRTSRQPEGTDQASSAPFGLSRRSLIRSTAAVAGMAAVAGSLGPAPATTVLAAQDDIQTNVAISLPLLPYGQPVTIDPHRTINWGPFWTLLPHVFSGLLRFDQNGGIEPDLAESVEPNSDLTVWTAKLKPNLTFASGRAITANEFVQSWKRALSPSALSPMSAFMQSVKGFEDFTSGKSEDIGFAAKDDTTVEITLAAPLSSFPAYLATFVWAVVDSEILADASVENPFLADAGAGAWRFTEFVDDDHLTMEPNSKYWDDPSPSITKVTWTILSGDDAEMVALAQYADGAIASADVPISQYDAVSSDDNLKNSLKTIDSQGSTLAIGLDFNQAPFDDVRIRRAIAAGIDRQKWATDIWKGSFAAGSAFTPPVTAANTDYTPPEGIGFDANQAKSWLADAKFDPETNATDIVYYQPATASPDDQQRHDALLKMIAENTGIQIRHDVSLTQEQIVSLQNDNGGRQFDIVWWWPDIASPALLGTVGTSDSPYMAGWFNWSKQVAATDGFDAAKDSQTFDSLIADATKSSDAGQRNKAYQDAEKLLLDNAVYIPLGYWVQRFVQQPWLQGTKQGPWTGRIPVRFDKDVVVRGKPDS